MKLDQITSLIQIRNFIVESSNNNNIDRTTLNELNAMQFLIDKKIIGLMKEEEFKNYIEYSSSKDVLNEVRKLNSHVFEEANKRK